MNTRRIAFWGGFIVILVLIIWGLIVAMEKGNTNPDGLPTGTPPPVTESDHVLGPQDAPVTIIEYSDFECPACQIYYFVLERLMASSTVPVRLVYRHFPLDQHIGAMPAALAAEAAGEQGKFWDMYRLIFENQTDWAASSTAAQIFDSYASGLGLDMDEYRQDVASSTIRGRITDDLNEGVRLGVSFTPTFFVNGKAIKNPPGYEAFETLIQEAAQAGSN